MVAVVDNLVDCYAYTGNEIRFGIDGMRFAVYSRYDKEGHLSITMFKESGSSNTNQVSKATKDLHSCLVW